MIDENIDSNIAIIGMDCQIPGATNISQFWHNLRNGIESISDFSKEELIESKVPLDKINNPKYVARRGIVNGVDKFDAGVFYLKSLFAKFSDLIRKSTPILLSNTNIHRHRWMNLS